MIFFGIVIGIVIMAAMIYLAIDKKSNFQTRVASLIALAVMILTVIICIILILTDTAVPFDPSTLIVGAPVEVQDDNTNIIGIILPIIFLLAMFAVIVFLAMKEHKKHLTQKKDKVFTFAE